MASPPDLHTAEVSRELLPDSRLGAQGALWPAAKFVTTRWLTLSAISALVLIPVFWHREIEADDLGSHLYNAWLVQLIHRGQAHGLWIDHRWNNILFDYLLSGFGALFGLHAAEKIAVSMAVLIFFWGAFALICAASRRVPWHLLPLIGMATYVWTFQLGLFNYYIAVGLSFFALAILWRGRPIEWLVALALAPLIVLAHPLALFWLAGAGVYVTLAERVPRAYHVGLLIAGVGALFAIHEYLWTHYIVEVRPHNFWVFNGADQFVLFSGRYRIIEYAFLAFIVAAIVWDACLLWRQFREHREQAKMTNSEARDFRGYSAAISLELYVLAFAAVLLLPHGAHVPGHIGAVALLTDRLTSISVVLLICLVAAARPQAWHLAVGAALAAVFFGFIYQDTGKINRMETEIAALVRTLPRGARVMGTIVPPRGSRVGIQHILDRACIGYCFSYGNYEAGSKMFRVRAVPGNSYVLADYDLATETELGNYVVQSGDLPVWQVYECGSSGRNFSGMSFCVAALKAGKSNSTPALLRREKR
ncbi:MAG: hypothetical protein ACRD8A_07405 [Candidatus Acidiferrales bacterium]